MRKTAVILLIVAAAVWAADWVTVEADADAYVYFSYRWGGGDQNFGGEPDLYAMYYYPDHPPDDALMFSYIHFDFDGIDPETAVLEAVLSIYVHQQDAGTYRVGRSLEAWDEYEITYETAPLYQGGLGTWTDSPPVGQYSDVTDLDAEVIEDMVDKPAYNHGIVVYSSRNYSFLWFSSREGGFPPRLKLLISGVDVEEASWGEIKAAF